MKYRIVDTFNSTVVSSHRTLKAALKADEKFARAVKRANGKDSYITTSIQCLVESGVWLRINPEDAQ